MKLLYVLNGFIFNSGNDIMGKLSGDISHMMTKKEFIEMIEEAIPEGRQITAYTIATVFDNNCMYESVDTGNEYFRMLGILDDQKYNLMSDLREENKQRLKVMAEQEAKLEKD